MNTEEAKQVLRDAGYFVDNLWQIVDVTDHYECSEQMAQSILEDSLTNDTTMERIWFSIDYLARERGLKSKNK